MNPITAVKSSRGMSRRELAIALDVSAETVRDLERGRNAGIGPKVVKGLEAIGENAQALQDAYKVWRKEKTAQARQGAAQGLVGGTNQGPPDRGVAGRIIVKVDGAALGNPGPGGAGVQIVETAGRVIYEDRLFLGTEVTNQFSELAAVRLGAEAALLTVGPQRPVLVLSDSQAAVEWITGGWKCNTPHLITCRDAGLEAIQHLEDWRLEWRRAGDWNADVDALAKLAASEGSGVRVGCRR